MKKKIASFAVVFMLSVAISATSFASPGTVDRYVNFRSAPSTSSSVYASLKPGSAVDVLEKVNSYWLKISVNGKVGYVSPSYVNYTSPAPAPAPIPVPAPQPSPLPPSSQSTADKIIAHAHSLIGVTSYKYGFNQAPSLLDCSSFTKYVFGMEGISLKWGTKYQKDAGSFVDRGSLRKGDLLFFTVGSSTSIGHVGIYTGDGNMIHNSPSLHGVGVSSITSGYWSNHYVTARRVLP